jgi:hypothetical protein
MAVETKTMNAPIQPNFLPAVFAIAPTGPILVDLPIANSAMINGTDHISRKITHGIRKEPPPFWATILEKRHSYYQRPSGGEKFLLFHLFIPVRLRRNYKLWSVRRGGELAL